MRFIQIYVLVVLLFSCNSKDKELFPDSAPVAKLQFPSDRKAITGTIIVISGENFASNPSDNIIKVGGVPVTFVERLNSFGSSISNDRTKILLTCVPPGAESGEVTLTVGSHTVELGGIVVQTYRPTGQWKQMKDYPAVASEIQNGFVINGKVYTGFAINPETNLPCLLSFDPVTNKWERKADFPGGDRTSFVAFAVGGKGYVGLGNKANAASMADSFEKDFWEYDPLSDKWNKKADFPGNRRSGAYSMAMGGKGYVGGGLDVSIKIVNDFWEYDPQRDVWVKKKSFPRIEAFSYGLNHEVPITFSSKNYGYFISGEMADVYGLQYACWVYVPNDDDWYYLPEMPLGTNAAFWSDSFKFGFSLDEKAYIGVRDYDNFRNGSSDNFFVFDERTSEWNKMPHFPGTPWRSAAWVVGRKAYVGLSMFQSDLWEFTH